MRITHIAMLMIICLISQAQAQSSTEQKTVIPVNVQKLSELLVKRALNAPAEVLPKNNAQISSEITGVIEQVNADVGQLVNAGDELIRLQSIDYDLSLKVAQASLKSTNVQIEQAKQRLNRANNLKKSSHISADELLDRETDLKVLRAQRTSLLLSIDQAQRDVDKTSIVAPFTGVIEQRMAQVGSFVNIGTVLMNLVESDRVEVEADIPMHLSATVQNADGMLFKVGEKNYDLSLTRLSPLVQPGTRAQKARFTFTNQPAPIGASGEIIWYLNQGLLPADLLVNRNQKLGIFVASNGKALFQPIANAQEGRPVSVEMSPDTPVIVGGRERLQDGDPISTQ